MPLTSNGRTVIHHYPELGVVQFDMRDGQQLVHCMVSDIALENLAARDDRSVDTVEAIFNAYRPEIEKVAARQYEYGTRNPIIRVVDLVEPPPLPG
jgi:hypothetical protein